ncbi:probable SepF protein [Natronomonas pharaonis DSM 2160]|uniref:Probable SepF protein n=1 Tax=Natronomonas pharaonis (strain ATCC 35678 / DSM 2160 / CIP 103997 / JCM 8858 / NBRC 14720 / NCIMB 2260 / Gabara) TaxID=348780 RepID=A0A1U7ETL8_NATPD|nr:cell division protein SepF [Natronomonas pharaonis]CAI48262.1 probable SepF protein [Natronomonas pharaonis DSM 2160]
MGLMSKLLGGNSHSAEDYVELDVDDFDASEAGAASVQVRFTDISEKNDVIDIKDAVYDGDIVIADIIRHTTSDRTMEHILDELKQVANEVGGDIVQKEDDQLIITPAGVGISRSKIGR